jgi:RNA polymerase sigma-70 factor (ECF subfamily)
VKTWLFTTLHRAFLGGKRRVTRFPHLELEESAAELPSAEPISADRLDGRMAMEALVQVDEPYRSALALFYLEDHSYREIAEILEIPAGTVMSRLSRGKEILRKLLAEPATHSRGKPSPNP